MIARFPGQCRDCGNHIEAGADVVWQRGQGIRHQAGQCPTLAPVTVSAPAARIEVEDAGVYVMPDGSIVKVKANRAKTRTYALRWSPSTERLLEDGSVVFGDFVYEANLVAQVASAGRKMTLIEAKAFLVQYGRCVRCGRGLKLAESVEQGLGPVCVRYFGWAA